MRGLQVLLTGCVGFLSASAQTVHPWPPETFPRAVLGTELVRSWDFDQPTTGWRIARQGQGSFRESIWQIESTGPDLILEGPPVRVEGAARLTVRMRSTAKGPLQVFWIGQNQAGPSEEFSTKVDLPEVPQWREYTVEGPADHPVRQIRLDPCNGIGQVEIDWIRLEARQDHPLTLDSLRWHEGQLHLSLQNRGSTPLEGKIQDQTFQLEPGARKPIHLDPPADPFDALVLRLESPGLPSLERSTFVPPTSCPPDWHRIQLGERTLCMEPQGRAAAVLQDEQPLAWALPLLWDGTRTVKWNTVQPTADSSGFQCKGEDGLTLTLQLTAVGLQLRRTGRTSLEGPVWRVPGTLEQAVLPGLEHLGHGEKSSTDLDIHGPGRIRHSPDPLLVAWPFMAVCTDQVSMALQWEDPSTTRPVLAVPDFFEGTGLHRLALRGQEVRTRVRLAGPWNPEEETLENALRWGLQSMGGLPPLPPLPRSAEAQWALNRKGLMVPELHVPNQGWYHAVIPGERYSPEHPMPFADHLACLFRLSGNVDFIPGMVPGGAHLEDPSIWFLRNQAKDWLNHVHQRATQLVRQQQGDGAFRYAGPLAKGHFEATSSGQCARPTRQLLEAAYWTGEEHLLQAGLKGLSALKRFRTPRGAQVWECPLHAPDILASAHAIQANLIGYQLTQDPIWLKEAVRWAWSGLPYIYLWDDGRDIMRYATIATFCATQWEAPLWIGRPVQWCGLVYADALANLAAFDDSLDWKKLAWGILISGEWQQYTEGPTVGLLADSVELHNQKLHPYDINPCALDLLRRKLEGQPTGLHLARKGNQRLISPFPIRAFTGDDWQLEAPQGLEFQVLLDLDPVPSSR